ncbi:MAG: methyltransferase domain-containing protein [Myxococcota bacterium]|nr:methyltransferase domain-containing protein [Myxococcota bacterium]
MNRFAAEVCRLRRGDRIVLWHQRTGRHAALSRETLAEVERWPPELSPPPQLAAVARRLDGLGMLSESTAPRLSGLRPARSRRVLLLPDVPALWLPLPTVRTPGGYAYAERHLSTDELALWRACNGSRTVDAVAERAGVTVAAALSFFAELTDADVQALQLRDRVTRTKDPALLHLVSAERPANVRLAHQHGPGGETTLSHWHRHDITDGSRHFDDRETTVAHAFALPHPGFSGEPYGARLHRVLEDRGMLPPGDGMILEIGPGDGELGEAWLARTAQVGRPSGELVRLDASPELLATQRDRMPGTRELLGTATAIPLPDASVSLVLCNEVIADLSAVPHDAEAPDPPEGAAAAVAQRLAAYRIPPLPGRCAYNLGAWKLIEELSRVLAPGGAAVVTEFGGLDEIPRETAQLDHPEVSIHFGHLVAVARARGLQARCIPLDELLRVDLTATWLSRHSYEALRARMRSEGRHLAARAWTPERLSLPWRVEGLEWVPLSDEGPGPLITRFMALLLIKA